MNRNHWEKDGWEGNALDQRWSELMKKDNWVEITNNLVRQRDIYSSIFLRIIYGTFATNTKWCTIYTTNGIVE